MMVMTMMMIMMKVVVVVVMMVVMMMQPSPSQFSLLFNAAVEPLFYLPPSGRTLKVLVFNLISEISRSQTFY